MGYTQTHSGYGAYAGAPGGRSIGIGLVILFHLLLAYALVHGLSLSRIALPASDTKVVAVDPVTPIEQPHVPLDPEFKKIVVTIPPEVVIKMSPPPPGQTIDSQTKILPEQDQIAALQPGLPVRIEASLDRLHSSEPIFPAISRRLGETGSVTLNVLVGPDGTVEDVKLVQSSGFARLDDAAIEAARNRSKFRPGTLDGKPAAMWFPYRYRFELK